MRKVYTPSTRGRHPVIPVLGALVLSALVFLILPFTQLLSNLDRELNAVRKLEMSLPPPPPPPEPPPPPDEEEEEEEEPEMEQQQQQLSLSQLELALNPGMGGAMAALNADLSFAVKQVDVIEDIKIFEITEVDRRASRTFVPDVTYPPSLRRERIVGKAKLTFVVNTDGSVGTIENIEDVSHPDFIEVFKNWVKLWRFEPAMKDGKAVPMRVRQPLVLNP